MKHTNLKHLSEKDKTRIMLFFIDREAYYYMASRIEQETAVATAPNISLSNISEYATPSSRSVNLNHFGNTEKKKNITLQRNATFTARSHSFTASHLTKRSFVPMFGVWELILV